MHLLLPVKYLVGVLIDFGAVLLLFPVEYNFDSCQIIFTKSRIKRWLCHSAKFIVLIASIFLFYNLTLQIITGQLNLYQEYDLARIIWFWAVILTTIYDVHIFLSEKQQITFANSFSHYYNNFKGNSRLNDLPLILTLKILILKN